MAEDTTRVTIELPADLLAAADRAVRQGDAASRDDLVVDALRHELDVLARRREPERVAIDATFARMADDADAQAEALRMDQEFATASWEALRRAEYP